MFIGDPRSSELVDLLHRGFAEAKNLDHGWLDASHFFLALLDPEDVSPAGEALRRTSLTHELYSTAFEEWLGSSHTPKLDEGLSPNPVTHQCFGRAEGLAVGLGAATTRAEHLLFAILWEPQTSVTFVLSGLGVAREEIRDHLSDLTAVPVIDLPELIDFGFSERVFVPMEKLSYLTGTIPKLLPPGTRFGFNHDGKDRAWVFAGTEDLADYVALALERESGTERSKGNAN